MLEVLGALVIVAMAGLFATEKRSVGKYSNRRFCRIYNGKAIVRGI